MKTHGQAFRGAIFLVVLSILCGLGTNQIRSRPLALNQAPSALADGDIGLLEARQRVADPKYVFLDARPPAYYQAGHLPGAISLPVREFPKLYPTLEPGLRGKTLVVYCGGPRCPKADMVRGYLETKGHRGVLLMRSGIKGWAQEGLTVVK